MTDKYRWSSDNDLPVLETHSLAKHEVLEAYLLRYVEVLAADPRIPALHLDLVDGFSGGGLYQEELTREIKYGSPLIFLNSIRAAQHLTQQRRTKKFSIISKYYFVDSNRQNVDFLQKTIRDTEFALFLDKDIYLIHGEFSKNANTICDDISGRRGAGRSIFFLARIIHGSA